MPGIPDYLERVCQVCPDALPLHSAVRHQLSEMPALNQAGTAGSIEPLLDTVHSTTSNANLRGWSQQTSGYGQFVLSGLTFQCLTIAST